MDALQGIFRWLHILAGILWIGHLYFFNFVNGQMAAKLDGDTKKKVVPELMPRALFWFRWGAAWTWITGLLLLLLVFYHQRAVVDDPASQNLTTGHWVMLAVTLLAVFLYDALYKSGLAKNVKTAATVGFVLLSLVTYLMVSYGHYNYRGMLIHTGTMFGTIMAFNVWFRIWPAQQKIITAVKNGAPPDAAVVALAAMRSRHNTYLSVPVLWTMINQHMTVFAGGALGIPSGWRWAWAVWLLVILVSWHIVYQLYKKAGKVQGF